MPVFRGGASGTYDCRKLQGDASQLSRTDPATGDRLAKIGISPEMPGPGGLGLERCAAACSFGRSRSSLRCGLMPISLTGSRCIRRTVKVNRVRINSALREYVTQREGGP